MKKTSGLSLEGNGNMEGTVMCRARSVFFEENKAREVPTCQSTCVESDEQVERLVRRTNLRLEDGDK